MKKILILLIMILSLTGCKDYIEINDLAILTGIVIDYTDNMYEITAQLIVNDKKSNTEVFTTKSSSINEAIAELSKLSNKEVFISHLKVLIVTDNIIKNNIDFKDYFLRSSKSKMNFYVYVINKDIKDKVLTIYKDTDGSAIYLEKMMKFNQNIFSSSTPLKFSEYAFYSLEKGYDKSYVNKWLNYDKDVPGSGVYENNIKESVNYLSSTYYCEDIIDDIKNINCDKNSTNYKISLLSLYDYYKAGGKSSFLNNGETFYLGTLNKDNHNYYITSDGEVSINEISTKTYAVRPVITIISSSVLLGGKGTKDDPYRILEIKPSTLEDTTINTYVSFSNQVFKVIDNSTDATKVALNGVIKENDIDVVKSFGGKNNKYSNSKNTVGYYLNNTYLKTLDSKNIIKSNWYIGALSLDNLDYSNEKNTKVNLSVGMLSLGDMFVGDINNVLTLSRGIESDQIINVINKEGNFYGDFITSKYNLRPALYLNNELKITGGNGTFDAPYELGVSDEKGQE